MLDFHVDWNSELPSQVTLVCSNLQIDDALATNAIVHVAAVWLTVVLCVLYSRWTLLASCGHETDARSRLSCCMVSRYVTESLQPPSALKRYLKYLIGDLHFDLVKPI